MNIEISNKRKIPTIINVLYLLEIVQKVNFRFVINTVQCFYLFLMTIKTYIIRLS